MRTITIFLLLLLILVSGGAHSAPIFFQISGNDGAGSINGTPFTTASWVFEIEMDDAATPVTTSNPNSAIYDYVNVRLSINGEAFVLDLDLLKPIIGSISLSTTSVGPFRDTVAANFGTTRVLLFGRNGDFYPAILNDVRNLLTFNSGVSVNNSGADQISSKSIIILASVLSKSGDTIILDEEDDAGDGGVSGSTSRTSAITFPSNSIPALPFTHLVLLSLCIGFISKRKLSKIFV